MKTNKIIIVITNIVFWGTWAILLSIEYNLPNIQYSFFGLFLYPVILIYTIIYSIVNTKKYHNIIVLNLVLYFTSALFFVFTRFLYSNIHNRNAFLLIDGLIYAIVPTIISLIVSIITTIIINRKKQKNESKTD